MKVLTDVHWDGCAMGKTIALKLSEKEDQIVTQINKQGISNSELLRSALRQYFEYLQKSIDNDSQQESTLCLEEPISLAVQESFEGLKQDLQELREQTKKTQQQIENDIAKLQKQLQLLSIKDKSIMQGSRQDNAKIASNIHHEVDAFLKKRSQQIDLWKK
jgi:hypothetical protein